MLTIVEPRCLKMVLSSVALYFGIVWMTLLNHCVFSQLLPKNLKLVFLMNTKILMLFLYVEIVTALFSVLHLSILSC